jgi:hypothetical protein
LSLNGKGGLDVSESFNDTREVVGVDPLVLRFIERITAVLIGGFAIYLGYHLFLRVPEHKDSAGKVMLPWNISVVMSRIGPGVFFALFGAIAVGIALVRPIEIGAVAPLPGTDAHPSVRYMGDTATDDMAARADARALLRKQIAELNTIPRELRPDLAAQDRDSIQRTIARVKLALMKPVWGDSTEGFGDASEFEKWVLANEPEPPPASMAGALALYRYGRSQ